MKNVLIVICLLTPLMSLCQEFGYFKKTGIIDSVKVVLLITNCDTCYAESIKAIEIREKEIYYSEYSWPERFREIYTPLYYLYESKRRITDKVFIWMVKYVK